MGMDVHLYTYGSPRAGDSDYQTFVDGLIEATNLRAVYCNDPIPTVPGYDMGFRHVGTEVHFYTCNQYLAYPTYADDEPLTNPLDLIDHGGYECLSAIAEMAVEIKNESSLFLA